MMLNFRENPFPHRRQSKYKTALGNTSPRYNSQVNTQRKKYYINSTRNSGDVPEWMSRTQRFFVRQNSRKQHRNSMYANPEGSFMETKQKWIYESTPQSKNISGQFQTVRNKKARTKWQMKGQTFEFGWPKKQNTFQLKQFRSKEFSEPKPKVNTFFKYELPKYGLKQSPLHRQRQTQIKIGHSAMIDSVYIK